MQKQFFSTNSYPTYVMSTLKYKLKRVIPNIIISPVLVRELIYREGDQHHNFRVKTFLKHKKRMLIKMFRVV